MAAIRTQIYLTEKQRAAIDELRASDGKSMAEFVRDALDAYLAEQRLKRQRAALSATFGSEPDMEYPSRDDWDRGYG